MNVSMKKGLLAMVGAVALAGAGTAQAADQYAIYKGTTTLTTSTGATAVCWLTIAGTIDENGLVTIKAAGARPGDYPTCSAIYLGNIPWTGTLSNLSGPGTVPLDTSASLPGNPSTVLPATGDQYGGVVTGISYPGVTPGTQTGNSIPTQIDIVNPATWNYGSNCAIEGTLNLIPAHG
tara:strand:- start:176 stop:709 length:534 start_codon:yes stop_codon:yes gene_type:complete